MGGALTVAALVLSLRYWFLPNIESYREDIAAAVSRAASVRITIGRITADWDGMRPHLKLDDVSVYDKAGRKALDLSRVESTIAWRSLAALTLHFHSLDIYRPALDVRRDARGVLSVAGIELETDDRKGGGFSEWLLQQPDVEVHGARVSWTDELRRAPPLALSEVSLHMVNRGSRHRFGLRALPPAELAGPIDLRGDVRGNSAELVANWNGRLFLQLDSADLASWGPWTDLPIEVTRGAGAIRAWLTFTDNRLAEITSDVRLSTVRTRLRKDLPELDLDRLSGRIAWKQVPSGFEFSTVRLALEAGDGAALPPADFLVRVTSAKDGAQRGELQANALNLAPLVIIADRLPIGDEVRKQLVAYSPRGSVHDLALKWQGALPSPETYSARGRFEGLAFNGAEKVPGISGLSGNVDATEKSGSLHLAGSQAHLDMPEVFGAPLAFDSLTAQLGWTRSPDRTEVRFSNVSFANTDAAGTASGSYKTAPQGRGDLDLTGTLTRADARSVSRYMPVNELKKVRPWLERAIVAGTANDVRFRVKGRLDDFPFAADKQGIFQVSAKITGGALDYADRWPRIENMAGELQFRGSRMDFGVRQASIYGVKLSAVQGEIADMRTHPEVLNIRGEAEGATSEFLGFIVKSPVNEMIDRFSEAAQAQGSGRLALKLALPLGQAEGAKIAGTYVFNGNNIAFERDIPPLEQASGRIEFTENSVRVPAITGTFLGGPITIGASSQRDSPLRVTMQGRVNADNVRKLGGPSWMQSVRGAADWRGSLTMRRKTPDLLVESNLQGITSTLPAPFGKAAGDTVPLRIERHFINAQQDRISVVYGDILKAELARRNDGKHMNVERGSIRLGAGDAGEPDRPGVWVRGALKTFNFDEWLTFTRVGRGGRETESTFSFAGAEVKLGQVDFFGRRFSDVGVNAWSENEVTQISLVAPNVEGGVMWKGEGKGRLTARLKKLTMPSSDAPLAPTAKPPPDKTLELPALDVIVEQFQFGQKQLGRLELNAVHQERDWKIEKLRISSADNVLNADGLWQGWLTQPRTQLKFKMDVTDIGKTLARWALPAGVKGGTAKIEGQLSWAGSPPDFDYPSLSGTLEIEAAKGQFVKVEPGIAKLLGILSLQSLPRRISLDFRDVFSEGFAFDGIVAPVRIERGIASTDNFRMAGPSARIVMTGEVDLSRETQNLRVRVSPHLSEAASLAGALLGGPIVGAAAFVAQKLLRDPIEKLATFEYNVTGNWSDPQVSKGAYRPALLSTRETP